MPTNLTSVNKALYLKHFDGAWLSRLIEEDDGDFYFYDETWQPHGPFSCYLNALNGLYDYVKGIQ